MTSTEKKPYPWLIVLAAIAFAVFVWLNWFPPGGIDDQMTVETTTVISKSEATVIAEDFIASQYDVDVLDTIVSYNTYQNVNGYLLRERIFDLYESTWKSSIPIDYYEVFTQDIKNDLKFKVYLRMDNGHVYGWELLNPSEYTGSPQGEQTKQNILADMGYPTEDYPLSRDTLDLVYHHQQVIGEASLHLQLRQQGDLITGFVPVFELPESYTAWKEQQDFLGAKWSLISQLLWFGLAIAAIVFMAIYRKTMTFSRGVLLTLAFLIPYLIHNVNMYPGYMLIVGSSMEALGTVLFSQFFLMLMGITVYLSFVAGDGMWRKLDLHLWPSAKEQDYGSMIVSSMGKGYLICLIVLGFQSLLFFIAGKLFDIWATSDPLMSTHNLLEPALYPLLAWSAAISEEAVFRLFGIVFFVYIFRWLCSGLFRITGWKFLQSTIVHLIPAVVLSNMIWALGHTGYSIYPIYTRFIEVTLLGFIFAYAFLRYGLITAIFAHATMDIIIMSLQIMMGDPSHALLGFTYMLMPALVAWLIRFLWRQRALGS
ncbi:MAG: CPBP family intramembrane glutamic endopeptidase [Paenibacillaceae bacterium]